MSVLSFAQPFSLPRCQSNWLLFPSVNFVQLPHLSLKNKRVFAAAARKKVSDDIPQDESGENGAVVKKRASRSGGRPRTRRKEKVDEPGNESELEEDVDGGDGDSITSMSEEGMKKKPRRTRKKVSSELTSVEEGQKAEKKVRRRRKTKKDDDGEDQGAESESEGLEDSISADKEDEDSGEDIELKIDEGEDISYTYGWPPLVCCFGAAQHAFVPAGRPANRLIDYEIHERMKDALWAPEKFIRAPGGSAGSVALALATLGGKVAFMGKLGEDDLGHAMLGFLNVNNVQTRSVRIDGKRATAMTHMKVSKRGRMKMTTVKPCAEDSLSKAEINIDVLKQAKMFYFSTHSLLDRGMGSTTLQAIKISKKLGGVIFYDVNLPMPLWQSSEEAKSFIQEAWSLADVIEVTKQELEFLSGINPAKEFDTKNNNISKFTHYDWEVVAPLWHENLKVLFVTNGTSKIHYYTEEHNGAVHGMEAAPITPFTCDMSASGDGIVAGLVRMLTVQPDLITDKEYLEHSIKYAIDCGVIDQWLLAQTRGFPPKEDINEEGEEEQVHEKETDEDDEEVPDPNGISSVTEKEYRTLSNFEAPERSHPVMQFL